MSFGERWETCLKRNAILNVTMACNFFGVEPDELLSVFMQSQNISTIKHGLHIAQVPVPQEFLEKPLEPAVKTETSVVVSSSSSSSSAKGSSKTSKASAPTAYVYVINGFYPHLKKSFQDQESVIHYYVIEWNNNDWNEMMSDIVGHKNPALSSPFSLRGQLLAGWEHYGLPKPPDELDNCLYVSKSSFFAMKDRVLLMAGSTLYTDHFAKRLIAESIPLSTIQQWMLNPESDLTGKGNILELTQGQGTNESLQH